MFSKKNDDKMKLYETFRKYSINVTDWTFNYESRRGNSEFWYDFIENFTGIICHRSCDGMASWLDIYLYKQSVPIQK